MDVTNQCQLVAEDTMRWKRGVHQTGATTQYRKDDLDAGEILVTVFEPPGNSGAK
jgi:hypothetical protein